MTDLRLHELTGSPNSIKVRVALGYKGLEYERVPFEVESFPGDRSALVKLSRQPRCPVLEHGKAVLFDSGAILRYLEANFPDAPPIFVDDYAAHAEIETWELFSRTKLGEAIGMIFGQAFSPEQDASVIAKANELLNERTGALEDRLSGRDVLVGDHLTAADIVVASPLYLADLTDENAQGHPIAAFFQKNLRLGEGREKTRAWVRRVLANDPVKGTR
jgi:glutathione S-transferase